MGISSEVRLLWTSLSASPTAEPQWETGPHRGEQPWRALPCCQEMRLEPRIDGFCRWHPSEAASLRLGLVAAGEWMTLVWPAHAYTYRGHSRSDSGYDLLLLCEEWYYLFYYDFPASGIWYQLPSRELCAQAEPPSLSWGEFSNRTSEVISVVYLGVYKFMNEWNLGLPFTSHKTLISLSLRFPACIMGLLGQIPWQTITMYYN